MKIDVWYKAIWYTGSDSVSSFKSTIIVKRISSKVNTYSELGGLVSYEVVRHLGYRLSGFVPDCWTITELSSLEQEML